MNTILAAILAAIPNVLMAVAAKIFTEKFAQSIIEKMIIFGLRKLATLTTSPVDDEIVEDVVKQIQGGDYVTPS